MDKSDEKNKTAKKTRAWIAVAIAAIVIAAGILAFLSLRSQNALSPYQLNFANATLNFRADLGKAAAVPALPDENSIRSAILSRNVSAIRISYVPDENYNGFYAADGFEIEYKLVVILKYYYGASGYYENAGQGSNCLFFEETAKKICISAAPVSAGNNLAANSSETTIFLSPSNETSVRLENSIIYLNGRDFSENGRKYTDLDLAVDRFLTILMK